MARSAYCFVALLFAATLPAQTFVPSGFVRAGAARRDGYAVAQLGFDWQATDWLNLHAQGIASHFQNDDQAGVTEAFADVHRGPLRLRAGLFFLPTSRENREDLWSSPYTITLSAVNSWIAEEFRPLGAELQWRHGDLVTIGGSAFRGNDTAGALLAWRGWQLHNRLATYGDVHPLPPLDPAFAEQRNDGSTAFGRDLDGRIGLAGRVRVATPDRWSVQFAHVDNRGDRFLYRGEYAWQTRFNILSGELGSPDRTVLAAEWVGGKTGMGFAPAGFVQMDFYAAYALLSHKRGRNRFSARYDVFATIDRDHSLAEVNTEHGRAWLFAWMFDVTPHWRAGAEFLQVVGTRAGRPPLDDRSVSVEVRYSLR